jgi:hypothetical protein
MHENARKNTKSQLKITNLVNSIKDSEKPKKKNSELCLTHAASRRTHPPRANRVHHRGICLLVASGEQIMSRRVEARRRGRATQEVTRGLIRATRL